MLTTGTVYGAESISNLVEEQLAKFVPPNYPHRRYVLDQLRRQFDEWYKTMFGKDEYDSYKFEIPGSLQEIAISRYVLAFITQLHTSC
jgi:hypothetical protein